MVKLRSSTFVAVVALVILVFTSKSAASFVVIISADHYRHPKPAWTRQRVASASHEETQPSDERSAPQYDTSIASQFKVVTCSASSCAAKRKVVGLDEYATFSSLWVRAKEHMPEIQVEETSCLGACKKAPCVGIEHAEYEGTVALGGMDSFEFSDRVFHRVLDEGDADRVWSCVEDAVAFMEKAQYEEEQ